MIWPYPDTKQYNNGIVCHNRTVTQVILKFKYIENIQINTSKKSMSLRWHPVTFDKHVKHNEERRETGQTMSLAMIGSM